MSLAPHALARAGDVAARLDAAIDAALAGRRIVGAVVLVARDGELLYRRAAGLADREAGMPMREDTIFRLASITKPIVAAATMALAEDGVLGLDDPVTRWLPAFRPQLADGAVPEITIGHLLTHTAGMGYRFLEPPGGPYHRLNVSDGLDQPGLGLEENLARIAAAGLAFAPGTGWAYSVSYDVLGAVIERAAGMPLADVVRSRVTAPLDMADTGFAVADLARLAAAYADGTPEPVAMFDGIEVPLFGTAATFAPGRILDPGSYPSGGAGMAGTAGDVLRFLDCIRAGGSPILGRETVAAMAADHVGQHPQALGPGWGFGLGWSVLVDPAAAETPQAEGTLRWGGAYGHSWFVDLRRGLTVVALTNTAFEGMSGAFPVEIRDAVYG